MKEAEWLACTDPTPLLGFLRWKVAAPNRTLLGEVVNFTLGQGVSQPDECDEDRNPRKVHLFFLAVAQWPESILLASEKPKLAEMVRHIAGNPFRSHPSPPSWPSTVVQLAESLYAGEDCAFALHDALLEAGHAELAEHFRQESWHPKGCWVVDLILGKE